MQQVKVALRLVFRCSPIASSDHRCGFSEADRSRVCEYGLGCELVYELG